MEPNTQENPDYYNDQENKEVLFKPSKLGISLFKFPYIYSIENKTAFKYLNRSRSHNQVSQTYKNSIFNLNSQPLANKRRISSIVSKSKDYTLPAPQELRSHSQIKTYENMNKSLTSCSIKSMKPNKLTDAHKSMNIRMIAVKDQIIQKRDEEIAGLKHQIELGEGNHSPKPMNTLVNTLQRENDILREQLQNLNNDIVLLKDSHQREMADLEYSLKIRYEDIIESKLNQQKSQFTEQLSELKSNRSKVELSLANEKIQ